MMLLSLKEKSILMPAPSWKITLESGNVFARLAKGSQEPGYGEVHGYLPYFLTTSLLVLCFTYSIVVYCN